MATNIGPKISVEGEAEYRKQMAQIIAQQKALAAEMKATVSGFASTASAQEKARASASVLDRQIANLSDALKAQQGQLDKAAAKYGENSKEALAYRTAVYNTTAELNKLKNQLGGTADAVEDTGDAMADAGKQGIKLGDIIKANVISDFIVSGLREVAAAAREMAAGFVQAAADVRAETAQYEQTFGDLAGEADAAIQKVADSAQTLPSLLKPAATSIYAFARSSGGTTAEAMDLMAESMQVAVDAAAYFDRSLADTTETLQSFLKGNYENDAALGISATEATRNAQAFEMFGQAFNDLTEIQKQQALLQMVKDGQELSGAMGQAAREADGWANVQGNLNEAWRQFSASKGQAMLDALIPAMQEVTSLLTGLTDGSLTAGQALQQAFAFASQQAGQLVAQLPSITSSLGGLGANLWNGLSAILPQIEQAGLQLIDALKTGIANNYPALMDAFLTAITNATANLRNVAGTLVDAGLDLILSLAQGIADGIPSLIENVPQIVTNIAGIINDNAPKILAAGVQVIVTLGKGLIQAIPTLVANIPEILDAIVNVFLAFNWLNLGKQLVTAIGNGIKGAGSFLSGAAKEVVNTLYNGVKQLPQTMLNLGRQMIQGLINGIRGMIAGVKDNIAEVASGAVSTLKNILGINSPSTVFKEIGVNLMQGLAIGMKDGSGEVMETVDDLAAELENRFQSLRQALSTAQDVSDLEYQSWLGGAGADATEAEKAARQLASLNEQLSAQAQTVTAAQLAYDKIVSLYGEASAEAQNYKKTLLEEVVAYQDLQEQIDGLQVDALTAGFDEVKASMDAAAESAELDFKVWQSQFADTVSESEKLQKQLAYQTKEMEAQEKVVQAAQDTYQELCDAYGETSDEAAAFRSTLSQEIDTYEDLKDAVTETTDALEESQDKLKQLADEADSFFSSAKSFASSISSLGGTVSDLFDSLKNNPFNNQADASETTANKLDVLNAQYAAAVDKVEELTLAFNESVRVNGAAAEETQELADQLADAESEASSLKDQVNELSASLEKPGFMDFLTWGGDVLVNLISLGSGFADVITAAKDFGAAIKGLPAIGSALSGLLGGAGASGGIGAALSGIASTAGSAIGSIGSALAGLASTLGGSLGSIGATLSGVVGSVGTTLSGVAGSIGAGLAGVGGTVSSVVGTVGSALAGLAGGPVGLAVAAVGALGSAFVVAGAEGDTLGEKLSNVFNGIADTIGNVVSTAFSWGRDLIEGIGNGIASAANWLFSGVKSIAQGIASFLHFSRPDKGPLREYEQWMPDMMAGMAKGIRLNSGLLEGAAQDAASRMQSALTIPADVAAAAVGTAPAQSAGRSLSITIGDVIVNGSSVQDVDELADRIVQKITRQVQRKEAAYGLV